VEANVSGSSAEMSTKRAVLLLGGLKLAPRPCIFAVLGIHEMDVLLIGYELTRVLDPGQRLVGRFCCLLVCMCCSWAATREQAMFDCPIIYLVDVESMRQFYFTHQGHYECVGTTACQNIDQNKSFEF